MKGLTTVFMRKAGRSKFEILLGAADALIQEASRLPGVAPLAQSTLKNASGEIDDALTYQERGKKKKQQARVNNELVDPARPELGRRNEIIRKLPVRDLTSVECHRLMAHSHSCKSMRRRAYLYGSTDEPGAYFSAEDAEKVKDWIANEEMPK